jgi:hypothetical protein
MGGIGHNRGPALDAGFGWRRYCWQRARAEKLGPALPLEVVRMRMRRAGELGLAYPDYAAILRGTGRDVFAFLFTCDAMRLRLERRLSVPAPVGARLRGIVRAGRLALAPSGEDPEDFRCELSEVSGAAFAAAGAPPPGGAGWGRSRAAILSLLRDASLPRDGVVLVGQGDEELAWAEAARLARFVDGRAYFPAG